MTYNIIVTTGVYTAVNNLCNDTSFGSTPPLLLCVAPFRTLSLGDYCGRYESYPENGNIGLVRSFTVIYVWRTALRFLGDELRNNFNKRFYYVLYVHKLTCRLHWSEICFCNPTLTQFCKLFNRHATIKSQAVIVKFRKVFNFKVYLAKHWIWIFGEISLPPVTSQGMKQHNTSTDDIL